MTEAVAEKKYYLPEGLPKPAPAGDGLGAEYWAGTLKHELWVQRCNACSAFQWGPEWICNECHSFDVGYAQVPNRGRIYSWERSWYPVHPALREGVPYVVVLVEIPEAGNVRMVGNLLGDAEQEVVIGSEVEAVFEDHADDQQPFTLVHWKAL
ncbi:DNA-binding protein [bacterium SCGC AG-212-C10]|nr:DNA-binding protein [bacterium SCGC AG-212-C10]